VLVQFQHDLLSSFYLWFENHLLGSKVKAYTTNLANNFTFVTGIPDVPATHYAYQGEFRQLVAEHNVDNPNSGFFVGSSFMTGDSDSTNVLIDHDNGRLIFPVASGTGMTITANSTVKDVNVYMSNDDEEDIIMSFDFLERGQTDSYLYGKTDRLDEKTYVLPACFITLNNSRNREFCFGGEEETITRVSVILVAKDGYTLEGVMSAFNDTARSIITHVPYEDFPYGAHFSIKNFPYVYGELIAAQATYTGSISEIISVNTSKLSKSLLKERLNKEFSVGFIDFDLSTYRYPRL